MNDNTKPNDTFTIPMEVRDGSTGELKETTEFTFTREEIREACEKDGDHSPFFIVDGAALHCGRCRMIDITKDIMEADD